MDRVTGYDQLCQLIENCIDTVTYQNIAECRRLLMVALNEEARLKKCVDKLRKANGDIQILFIAQPAMEPVLKEWYGEKYPIIGWKGKYTLDIIPLLKEKTEMSLLDGFLYFTEQPINTRDKNFTQIVETMQTDVDIRIFSNTIGEDLYEYHHLALYNQAMKVYEDINQLLELAMEVGGVLR